MSSITFLGTGTSTGVPQIGCRCKVCQSKDSHDKRLRTSALVETDDGRRILIDCGPDFRQQALSVSFSPIDAVLLTHEHYDHVGGLDDLRPFTFMKSMDIYANDLCAESLKQRMPYCFAEHRYPGVPKISLHILQGNECMEILGMKVRPIRVMHDKMPILGYRIGNMAYITDMSMIRDEEKSKLNGLNVLVVNALRKTFHHSHQTLEEALHLIGEVQPKQAYLVHMSHEMGMHAEVEKELPKGVHLAYDGLCVQF